MFQVAGGQVILFGAIVAAFEGALFVPLAVKGVKVRSLALPQHQTSSNGLTNILSYHNYPIILTNSTAYRIILVILCQYHQRCENMPPRSLFSAGLHCCSVDGRA